MHWDTPGPKYNCGDSCQGKMGPSRLKSCCQSLGDKGNVAKTTFGQCLC